MGRRDFVVQYRRKTSVDKQYEHHSENANSRQHHRFEKRIDNTLKYVTNTLDINRPEDNLRRLADLSVRMNCHAARPTEKTNQKMQSLVTELVNRKIGLMNDADSFDRIYNVFPEVETVMALGVLSP